jgi:predicted ester cyclase
MVVRMSKEDNIRVQSLGGPIAEARDWDRLGEVFAPDFVDHDPAEGQAPGLPGIQAYWKGFAAAFPDFVLAPEVLSADDEYVTIVATVSGTHTGEFLGHAPTGRRFSVRSIQTTKFADGRVVERWGSSDEYGLMRQLGLV